VSDDTVKLGIAFTLLAVAIGCFAVDSIASRLAKAWVAQSAMRYGYMQQYDQDGILVWRPIK
jgi:hypothetical protein